MELLLLPGFCETSEIWTEIVAGFDSDRVIHTPDLPGFGGKELTNEQSLREVAESLINNCNRNSDYFLIGHSLGGYLSLEIVRLYPERIKGICLFHSTAMEDSLEKKRSRDQLIKHIEGYGKAEFLRQFVPNLFSDEVYKTRPDLVKKMNKIVEKANSQPIIRYTKWMKERRDNLSILRRSTIPISYISGKEDKFLPFASQMAEAASIPFGCLYAVENAGHLAMLEAPAVCCHYLNLEIRKAESS